MKKIKISLKNFLDYAKIDYKEDCYDLIYFDFQNHRADFLADQLPKKYSYIKTENLEENELLRDRINDAYNRADESGLAGQAFDNQLKMVESIAEDLVDFINGTILDDKKALGGIIIDWADETVTINIDDVSLALQATREIINGEGMFYYETDDELSRSYNGKKNDLGAIEGHLHYLLNTKLISDIYGHRFNREWEVNSWDIDENYFAELIEEGLAELQEDPEELKRNIKALAEKQEILLNQFKNPKEQNLKNDLNRNVKSILKITT